MIDASTKATTTTTSPMCSNIWLYFRFMDYVRGALFTLGLAATGGAALETATALA